MNGNTTLFDLPLRYVWRSDQSHMPLTLRDVVAGDPRIDLFNKALLEINCAPTSSPPQLCADFSNLAPSLVFPRAEFEWSHLALGEAAHRISAGGASRVCPAHTSTAQPTLTCAAVRTGFHALVRLIPRHDDTCTIESEAIQSTLIRASNQGSLLTIDNALTVITWQVGFRIRASRYRWACQ